MLHALAIGMPGLTEWIIIGALGLLIFGKRLPEVGRSLGKGIVEFKKGLKEIDENVTQVDEDLNSNSRRALPHEERKAEERKAEERKAEHKFDPYTGKPLDREETEEHSSTKS